MLTGRSGRSSGRSGLPMPDSLVEQLIGVIEADFRPSCDVLVYVIGKAIGEADPVDPTDWSWSWFVHGVATDWSWSRLLHDVFVTPAPVVEEGRRFREAFGQLGELRWDADDVRSFHDHLSACVAALVAWGGLDQGLLRAFVDEAASATRPLAAWQRAVRVWERFEEERREGDNS